MTTEFLPIQLVGILKMGDLAGSRRQWRGREIGMIQSVNGIDTFPPVELKKLGKQRNCNRALAMELSVGWLHGSRESPFLHTELNEIILGNVSYSLKTSARFPRLNPKFFTPSHPGSALHPGMFSSVGVPTRLKMSWAWLRSLLPDNIGLPLNISPKTHLKA